MGNTGQLDKIYGEGFEDRVYNRSTRYVRWVLRKDPSTFYGRPVHEAPICDLWSRAAVKEIGRSGVEVEARTARWKNSSEFAKTIGDTPVFHEVVQTIVGTIYDGTWQQMLPEERRHEELPRALVGTPETVAYNAVLLGVPKAKSTIWLNLR